VLVGPLQRRPNRGARLWLDNQVGENPVDAVAIRVGRPGENRLPLDVQL